MPESRGFHKSIACTGRHRKYLYISVASLRRYGVSASWCCATWHEACRRYYYTNWMLALPLSPRNNMPGVLFSARTEDLRWCPSVTLGDCCRPAAVRNDFPFWHFAYSDLGSRTAITALKYRPTGPREYVEDTWTYIRLQLFFRVLTPSDCQNTYGDPIKNCFKPVCRSWS